MADKSTSEQSKRAANCSAGIIIVGDEILKGHTRDTNSYFLLRKLWSLGIKVGKVSVLADDVDEIAHEVKAFSSRFSIVITTGGIGPTHDDLTMAGIAKAFDEDLVLNEELIDLLSNSFDLDAKSKVYAHSSYLKMARVPRSLKISHGNDLSGKHCNFPLISVHNVYIFPGIPQYLEREFSVLESELLLLYSEKRFFLRNVYLSAEETEIASILQEVHEKFKSIVHLGSYPDISSQKFKVKLTLEADHLKHIEESWQFLQHRLPKDTIMKIEGDGCDQSDQSGLPCVDDGFKAQNIEKVYQLLDPADESTTSACVKGAWGVIQQTLQLYSLDELCISFNGGKDCTVLLHLLYAALCKQSLLTQQLNALYIRYDSPFPQAEEFISQTRERYNLNLITMTGNMKEALKTLKETHPSIKATLLGTRRHDPFSDALHTFSSTDPGWPRYMRVNPILDWHHSDVWSVIKECSIPYCSLYDQGYTSLGSAHNTAPNPSLKCEDGSDRYKPAFMLEDGNLERAGRN